MNLQQGKVFVQIGVFDGSDEFNALVKQYNPSKIILVEPYAKMNTLINKHYQGVNNYYIENAAITEETKGIVKLMHPKGSKRQQTFQDFYNKCFSLLPMDDWGTDLKVLEVPSLSFMDLCEKYDLHDIHFLQIDTEGYDSIIIKSIDFTKVKIDILKYENWSFPEDRFERYGEKKKELGVNGMNQVKVLLEGLGYTIQDGKADIIATKI